MGETVDWWSNIARRKLNTFSGADLPLEWRWCKLENVGPDAFIVTGGVPKTLKRGKRKGELSWKGVPCVSCVVTRSELAEEERAYETETGNCAQCYGAGLTLFRWTKEDGNEYRECRKCTGSGKTVTT